MSLRDAIVERVVRNDIYPDKLLIDKDGDLQGLPATVVNVVIGEKSHWWTFAKKNNMSADHIADVVLSYLLKGKR